MQRRRELNPNTSPSPPWPTTTPKPDPVWVAPMSLCQTRFYPLEIQFMLGLSGYFQNEFVFLKMKAAVEWEETLPPASVHGGPHSLDTRDMDGQLRRGHPSR